MNERSSVRNKATEGGQFKLNRTEKGREERKGKKKR